MRSYYLALLLIFVLFNCSNPNSKRSELIDFAPKSAHIIIKTSNFESLKSAISNSDFLQKVSKSKAYKNLEETLENTTLLKPKNEVLICFSKDVNDSLHYSFITKHYSDLFNADSLKNYTEETLTYKNKKIIKSTLNNKPLYSTIIDSTFFASSSKAFVDSLLLKTRPAVF